MRPFHPRLVVVQLLAFIGLALSVYLVWQHLEYQTKRTAGGLCTLVKGFDCSAIENSDYSAFLGIPTANFGAFYFAAFLALLIGFRPPPVAPESVPAIPEPSAGDIPPDPPPADPVPTDPGSTETAPLESGPAAAPIPASPPDQFWSVAAMFNAVGVAVSIGLACLSVFVVGSLCFGCMLVYSINILLMFALIPWRRPWIYPVVVTRGLARALPFASARLRDADSKAQGRSRVALIALAVLAPLSFYAVPKYIGAAHYRAIIVGYQNSPESRLAIHEWNIAKGTPGAPVQIVKFTDFQCPVCRESHHALEEIMERLGPGRMHIVYKNFPLDRECNPLFVKMGAEVNMHPGSCLLALLAQGAGSFGKFWAADDLFYRLKDFAESRDGHTVINNDGVQRWVDAVAAKTGLSVPEWRNFSLSDVSKQRLNTDLEEGIALGLTGTPGIFINGRRAPSAKGHDLEDVIRYVLDSQESR